MRPKRNRRLQFEVMESREVLSASLAVAPLAPPTLVIPIPPKPPVPLSLPLPTPHEVVLNGMLSGSYSAYPFPVSANAFSVSANALPVDETPFDLSGQGQVQPFGPMTVTGLYSLGSIQPGHTGEALILSNSQGTLTLELTGPFQRGFPPPPKQLFGFEITGGTGAFANATGRGTASLRLVAHESFWGQLGDFDLSLVGSSSPPPPQSQT
jgi:hypothetical protein